MLPGQYGNANERDDEHRLIARYAAKLSGRSSVGDDQQRIFDFLLFSMQLSTEQYRILFHTRPIWVLMQ